MSEVSKYQTKAVVSSAYEYKYHNLLELTTWEDFARKEWQKYWSFDYLQDFVEDDVADRAWTDDVTLHFHSAY